MSSLNQIQQMRDSIKSLMSEIQSFSILIHLREEELLTKNSILESLLSEESIQNSKIRILSKEIHNNTIDMFALIDLLFGKPVDIKVKHNLLNKDFTVNKNSNEDEITLFILLNLEEKRTTTELQNFKKKHDLFVAEYNLCIETEIVSHKLHTVLSLQNEISNLEYNIWKNNNLLQQKIIDVRKIKQDYLMKLIKEQQYNKNLVLHDLVLQHLQKN
jgi:hypothetical protein